MSGHVVVVLLVGLALSGCASDPGPDPGAGSVGAADCSTQVRAGTTVYTSYGFTERAASRYAVGDRAVCEDVGEDARGSVFPVDPEHVTLWELEDLPPAEVVAVRSDEDSFAVFVADTVPADERERILRSLDRRTD